ncbi:hypothetical protein [Proteus alimentorum]|uniref:hypothetical protein n=1 Tax=Proteus alimentorum TaxID=1973495 RepID=UPI0013EC7931|nr:hypothetical protein [Proteus alimentorum]
MKYIAQCPYHGSESDCNASHFIYLHIPPQNEKGIRYIQGRYRHNAVFRFDNGLWWSW